jgi:hypothetical protein
MIRRERHSDASEGIEMPKNTPPPYMGDIVIRLDIVNANRDSWMCMIIRSSRMTSMMPSGKDGSKISLYTGCSQAVSIKGMSLPFAVMIHLFKEALI